MFPKIAVILNPNNIVLVMRILISQVGHYIQFYGGLMSKFLIIPDDFDSDYLTSLMV
jgi:hypothetical protein